MDRIDNQQHFWNHHPAKQVWMKKDMSALKKDYGPDDLNPLLDSCNLLCCAAVLANQSEVNNYFLSVWMRFF